MRIPMLQHEAAERIEYEVKEQAKKAKRREASKGADDVRVEVKVMIESGDWTGASPRHLVALYELMHALVYEVVPTMTNRERSIAVAQAGGQVRYQFDGDIAQAIEFVRWAWQREAEREEWRRRSGRQGGRLDWRRLFSSSGVLTDYRVELARKAGA